MKFAKIINDIVDHIAYKKEDGYIEVNDNVFGGMKKVGDSFSYPIIKETEAELIAKKVLDAKAFLNKTDFKMTVDYFASMTTEEQLQLTNERASARAYVIANEIE